MTKTDMEQASKKHNRRRNDSLFDLWSIVHFVVSAALATFINPWVALIVTSLWEPVERFIVSPALAKVGILFGHESLKNSLSDMFFNVAGILFAVLIVS